MNYYSDQEISQVVEEPDRQPKPASHHVALNSQSENKPRNRRHPLIAATVAVVVFLYAALVNVVQVPTVITGTVAAILIGIFVYVSIKGD